MNLRDYWQIPYVLERLIEINPTSILDVGCGSGKYAMLAQAYLPSPTRIDGADADHFDTVLTPYDRVFMGDLRELELDADQDYDLAMVLDVIEHMHKPEAHDLIAKLLDHCRTVLITTPLGFRKQEVEGKPYMRHLSGWRRRDFKGYPVRRITTHPSWRTKNFRFPRQWQLMVELQG